MHMLEVSELEEDHYVQNFCALLAAGILAVTMGSIAPAQAKDASGSAQTGVAGLHDFDFLVGEWSVHHHRLKRGSHEWIDFEGTSSNRKLMDGEANMEEHALNAPSGAYRGIALRAYDSRTAQWAIWWLDERYPSGPLDPPVKGRFDNGIGTFYSDGIVDGRPIRTRFIWSNITRTSARWEQASSSDAGKTWETNWVMNFERDARTTTQPVSDQADWHDFDFLRGSWLVHHRYLRVQGNRREWGDVEGAVRNMEMTGGR